MANEEKKTIMEQVREGLNADQYIDALETLKLAINKQFEERILSEQIFRQKLRNKIRRVK